MLLRPAAGLRRWRRPLLALALLLCGGLAAAQEPAVPAPAVVAGAPGLSAHSHTIVFIHGMFMTPAAWDNWQAYFRALGYTTLAPAWPLHEAPVAQQRQAHPSAALGALTLDEVMESYRRVLRGLPEKPIVIGHSMGGLVAQKLLEEGLAVDAVAIDSAPPSGLIVLKWSFIRSNWPVVSPFVNAKQPFAPAQADFDYAFANCLKEDEAQQLYARYVVPESRLVGRGTSLPGARVNFDKGRGPLLLVAGGADHIIPAALNQKNFGRYGKNPSVTSFKLFAGRCHTLTVDSRWKEVAEFVGGWLGEH
jgi:pimeloyl-ACP methyl ester carboxylesterase